MYMCLRDYGFSEYSLRWLRKHHLYTISDITCLSFKDFKNLFKKVRKERMSDVLGCLAYHDLYLSGCEENLQIRKEYISYLSEYYNKRNK